MPYFFIFRAGDGIYFECPLQCQRCPEQTKAGGRCKLRACIGNDMCWIHLLSVRNLRIKDSGHGRGKGLFALARRANDDDIIFRRGDLIAEYEGELLTEAEVDRRYGPDNTAPYVAKGGHTANYWDAACSRSVASMANHAPGRESNALFQYNQRTNKVEIRAKRSIRNNTEIFINYGRNYRMVEPGVTHVTKQRRR